ncbi:MAG: hypothetical protein Q4A13_08275 [Fretibacterium sp.]|uniref:hypothetical protein n=1 Tax=Fretibacterium sp. OH1220_COT-178 TaxID=2491047 RepID=UPI000F5D9FB8|nr:hypothetical protein [Fretibacterium sp. OH1220_COT-178]MDO4786925.1 hypothetical protein [Fretibacterium sp.]RRD64513.1 hypothetical protein EII26_06885 [Fretibacterium sp. OH1220_COT-178]
MRIVQTNTIINTDGFVDRLERGYAVRRVNVDYEHVKEPVIVPRPQIEDFNSLVVVHDKIEQYG